VRSRVTNSEGRWCDEGLEVLERAFRQGACPPLRWLDISYFNFNGSNKEVGIRSLKESLGRRARIKWR